MFFFLDISIEFYLKFTINYYFVECDNGTFGANCASRCYCADNVACNKTTGQCPAGCAPGYMEESCHSGKRFIISHHANMSV